MAVTYPVRGSTPWDITLKKYIDSVAASGNAGFTTPMSFGAKGTGEDDDQEALVDCWEFAAETGKTVIIDRPYGFSDKIKHYGGMTVMQVFMPRILAAPTDPEPGLIALEDTAWYQYGDGSDGSGSANDNPGPIRGLYIDGKNIAGGGNGLFVMDAFQSSLYDLQVNNSTGIGVNVGRSQNCNFFNIQSGAHAGQGVLLKGLVAGQQGPGHNIFFGGHVHDNYIGIEVAGRSGDFFPPHDNCFKATLVETGRTAGKAVKVGLLALAGQTQFDDVNFTYGAQVGPSNPVEMDCAIFVDNPTIVAYSTIVALRGGSVGGGANKVTDGIRTQQSGAAQEIRLEGRVAFANVNNEFCNDGIVLGGADPLLSITGVDTEVTAPIDKIRVINGGTKLNAYTKRWLGNVFELPTGITNGSIQNPTAIGQEADAFNRFIQDWNGLQKYIDPATGATIGNILRNGSVFGVSGQFVIANSLIVTPTVTTISTSQAVTIDSSLTARHELLFSTGGVNVTSLAISNGVTGRRLRLSILGSGGVNSIIWPASSVIEFRTTAPQPISGVRQWVELEFAGAKWYEVGRSG